ncbi:uncharacterized protein LOC117180242 isoform X4 [Belonocnema kinseyi]|uniref:uncharacterized protein LOC117180242 isoform X4 n=1 Tax=Belonocnema kinseyi TaxID=2817044 RepID=UPI00143DF7D9|nr:uncharacterized protein LOC117180242 isoform X4 [Belonocnema kinseyi]
MENMDKNKRDNSSDFESSDDDMYTNAVARLKALEKKKKLQKKNIEEASFISLDLSMPIEIPDTDEIEEVKEQDAEPVMCDKRIESEAIPEVDASSSFDSSNESIDKGMQSPDVHEGKSASQTHFIATIVLDPDENEESMADVSINSISESDNYSIELKVLWRSHKVFRVDMRMYEPFQKAFDYFANLENVSTEQVLLLRNDKPVKPTDTPASLGISVIDIIAWTCDITFSTHELFLETRHIEKEEKMDEVEAKNVSVNVESVLSHDTNISENVLRNVHQVLGELAEDIGTESSDPLYSEISELQ